MGTIDHPADPGERSFEPNQPIPVYVGAAKSSAEESGRYTYFPNADLSHRLFGSRLIGELCSHRQPTTVVALYDDVPQTLVLATDPKDLQNLDDFAAGGEKGQVERIVRLDKPIDWVTGGDKKLFEDAFGLK